MAKAGAWPAVRAGRFFFLHGVKRGAVFADDSGEKLLAFTTDSGTVPEQRRWQTLLNC